MKKNLVRITEWINQPPVLRALCVLAIVAGWFWAGRAHADELITTQQLQDAAQGPSDIAMTWMKGFFGTAFVENPFKTGAASSTSVLGAVVSKFDSVTFLIGSVLVGYQVLHSITHSAEKGEMLGLLKTWGPIRLMIGVIWLYPAINGFSLVQGLMVFAAMLGNGAGNLVAQDFINSTNSYMAIIPSSTSVQAAPNINTDFTNLTQQMFMMNVCAIARSNHLSNLMGVPVPVATDAISASAASGAPAFGDTASGVSTSTSGSYSATQYGGWDYGECGTVTLSQRSGSTPRLKDSAVGFRSPSVDYAQIAMAMQKIAANQLNSVQQQTASLAQSFYDQLMLSATAPDPTTIKAQLDAIAASARSGMDAGLKSNTPDGKTVSGTIKNNASDVLTKGGWMQLGVGVEIFSEVSNAIADAQRSITFTTNPGRLYKQLMDSDNCQKYTAFDQITCQAILNVAVGHENAEQNKDFMDRVLDVVDPETPMGGRSIGQAIVSRVISGIAADSGGAGVVDPIVAAKNMGDYIMAVGDVLLGTPIAIDVASTVVPSGWIAKFAAQKVSDGAASLRPVAAIMIAMGTFLSVYIPMVFYITWLSICITAMRFVIEAVINSQLAGLAHATVSVHAEGFTAGDPNVKRLYQQLVNVLFWPMLAVIGLAAGMALNRFGGTLVLQQFPAAMASSQGNSLTGLPSIAAYIGIFCFLLFTIATSSANVAYELPSMAVGYLGMAASNVAQYVAMGAALGSSIRNAGGGATNHLPGGGSGGSGLAPTIPQTPSAIPEKS